MHPRVSYGASSKDNTSCVESVIYLLLGMLTLEFSSYLLEIPNYVYSTLSQLWLAVQLQADWFILDINERATLNINMPYRCISMIVWFSGVRTCN